MIAVSAGHSPRASGACYNGVCEHELAWQWAKRIVGHIPFHVNAGLVPTWSLTRKVDWINSRNAKLAVEIHFNSDPKHKGRGCETLYCPGSARGRRLAEIVHSCMVPFFTPNRGIKEGWYRMDVPGQVDYAGDVDGDENIDYFLLKTKCPAIIIEPEFIHRLDVIEGCWQEVCDVLATALVEARMEFVA